MNGSDVLPIDLVLAQMGFESQAAVIARRLLESVGVTQPKKRNVHHSKIECIRDILSSRFIRVCRDAGCQNEASSTNRTVLFVADRHCSVCRGRRVNRAAHLMTSTLRESGLTRLLVMGGSPEAERELREATVRSDLRLDVIYGHRSNGARTRALATAADVIVIWAGTIVSHAVTAQATDPRWSAKTVIIPRRGIEALAQGLIEHCMQRKELVNG